MYTSHIFIDLEMNPISKEFPAEKEACRAEIIEIGAVRLDADYNLTDRFTLFVRPRYSSELNRHVAKLTGIKLEDLQDAPDFREAMEFATAASAIAVTRAGAQASVPYRNEID